MRAHRGEEVTELAACVEPSIRDAFQPFVVVVEQLAQLQVDGGSVGLVHDLSVHEVGEGGHLVLGDDVVRLRLVADGDADLI